MAGFVGSRTYCHIYPEVTWGTKPGSPTYYHIPVTECTLDWQPAVRMLEAYHGVMDPKHAKRHQGMVQGSIQIPLHGYYASGDTKSMAQRLIEWGLGGASASDQDDWFPDSYGLELVEDGSSSPKKAHDYDGLRASGMSISGDDGSNIITLGLDLMGITRATLASVQSVPTDMERLSEFDFCQATLSIDSTATAMKSFGLNYDAGLRPHFFNNCTLYRLVKTSKMWNFNAVLERVDNTWIEEVITEGSDTHTVSLTLKGLHNGTGGVGTDYTQVVISFADVVLTAAPLTRDRDLGLVALSMQPLKPDSSTACVTLTWTDE